MIAQNQIESHLHMLEQTLVSLQDCRRALDDKGLTQQPAPGEWSAVELLAHLRAWADVFGQSIYTLLVVEAPVIPYLHPTVWMDIQGYAALSFDENWQVFQLNRQHLLRLLRGLPPTAWERSGLIKTQTRTVYGEMHRMALHEKGHYEQITALYQHVE